MKVHGNAALGPAGRLALVEAIESGVASRAAAAALNVAPARAHRWWDRWQSADEQERRRGQWLQGRSSRPHRQPRRLSVAEEEPILRARRETGLGPGRLAGICPRARSTIWKVLHRNGLSHRRRAARETYRRYEWSRPGALLQVDVARLARFDRPGHAVTGGPREDRRRQAGRPRLRLPALRGRRPLPLRLRRAAPGPGRGDRRRGPRPGDRALRRPRHGPPEAVMSDNGLRLPQLARLQGGPRALRRPPHPHPALHAPLERQGGEIHPDAEAGVGLRPLLARLGPASPGAVILPSLLQPAQAPQLPGRPVADQPCSQRPWAGQLAAAFVLSRAYVGERTNAARKTARICDPLHGSARPSLG